MAPFPFHAKSPESNAPSGKHLKRKAKKRILTSSPLNLRRSRGNPSSFENLLGVKGTGKVKVKAEVLDEDFNLYSVN